MFDDAADIAIMLGSIQARSEADLYKKSNQVRIRAKTERTG